MRVFVTFEGPEGAGKTTVIHLVAEELIARGTEVVLTREPGAGEFGQRIRSILLESGAVHPRAELMLFLADRAQHVAEVLRPELEAGKTVLCDRYTDSTLAYQGYGRDFDLDLLRTCNDFATGGLVPDLTLLFDIDPALSLKRLTRKDRLDAEPLNFHQKVREGFLKEAHKNPGRWVILKADLGVEQVTAAAINAVLERQLNQL